MARDTKPPKMGKGDGPKSDKGPKTPDLKVGKKGGKKAK